jgi:hypothetical protein
VARSWVVLVFWIPFLGFLIAVVLVTAEARDLEGRYTNSPLKPWFDQLRSRNGICCSSADGYVLEDPDWESEKGHYRVRVPRAPYSQTWCGSMCQTTPLLKSLIRSGEPWSGQSMNGSEMIQRSRSAALCQEV